jgi:hypothetical protein
MKIIELKEEMVLIVKNRWWSKKVIVYVAELSDNKKSYVFEREENGIICFKKDLQKLKATLMKIEKEPLSYWLSRYGYVPDTNDLKEERKWMKQEIKNTNNKKETSQRLKGIKLDLRNLVSIAIFRV